MLLVNENIKIPLREFEFKYARSSGKGGQNVNKVNSKAILHWNPQQTPSLTESVKQRFINRYQHRLTNEGLIQIQSERFRDQGRNAQDCLEKLKAMILAVAIPPKKRKATKPTYSSKLKRLDSKRRHSDKKHSRREKY